MDAARSKGLKSMEGDVLSDNVSMLTLMTRLDFTIEPALEDNGIKRVSKVIL